MAIDPAQAWAKNVTIEYAKEVTINLGNFQNVKPSYKVSVELYDNINPHDAKEKIKKIVDSWLEQEIEEIQREARG